MNNIPKGYKQTEVGVIPEDWEVAQLNSLGNGTVPPIKAGPFGSSLTKDTYVPSGYKVYGQEQVIRGDYHFGDYFISLSKFRELESCAVSPGDILLSLVGTVGKLLVLPDDAPNGVINPRLIRFSFDKKQVCAHFFRNLFEASQVQTLLARSAQGGTMGVLNASMLRTIKIPLPPITEQRTIAAALSDVDALLAKLDQLIAKKRDIKLATMQQLLTGKTRLPGFGPPVGAGSKPAQIPDDTIVGAGSKPAESKPPPNQPGASSMVDLARAGLEPAPTIPAGWEVKQLGDVLKVRHGKSQHDVAVADGSYPILATGGEIGRTNHYLYDKPSVLIGRKGTIDSPQYMETPFWTIDTLFFTEIYEIASAKFIFYKFNTINWRSYNEASGVPSLNASTIESIEFNCPSLPEQTAIATVLSDMDAEIAALETRRDKTRDIKQGMMQELLTGRIRLV